MRIDVIYKVVMAGVFHTISLYVRVYVSMCICLCVSKYTYYTRTDTFNSLQKTAVKLLSKH